jgi:hypothetical protein
LLGLIAGFCEGNPDTQSNTHSLNGHTTVSFSHFQMIRFGWAHLTTTRAMIFSIHDHLETQLELRPYGFRSPVLRVGSQRAANFLETMSLSPQMVSRTRF